MLVTILGAGASHDSVNLALAPGLKRSVDNETLYCPPLARELFSERPDHTAALNRFSQMSHLVPELRQAAMTGGEALEVKLRELQEDADLPSIARGLLAVRFYLQAVCAQPIEDWRNAAGGATNQSQLMRRIAQWSDDPVSFITFNYDRLLELAAEDVHGRRFHQMAEYSRDPNFTIFKPHGSVDWVEYVDDHDLSYSSLIEVAPALTYSGEIDHSQSDAVRQRRSVPAIAIPVDAGKTYVCPPDHLEQMRETLRAATRLLIVGWRATEAHFLQDLQQVLCSPSHVAIVDVTTDAIRQARLRLLHAGVQPRSQMGYSGGFSAFATGPAFEQWMAGELAGDPNEHGNP
jgi:hypothetical protein